MSQPIIKERRRYNRYVANQTLEDFSIRYTDKSARKQSPLVVSSAALGSISFLALEVIGANIAIFYGLNHLIYALLVAIPLIYLISRPIALYAVKHNIDIDLLTRGAGFGYLGSSITSLVYACFALIFFAFEATILANMLKIFFQLPLSIGYILSTFIIIPLILKGFSFISKFQRYTQFAFVFLQLISIVGCVCIVKDYSISESFFSGIDNFNILFLGNAVSILLALISQIGEQVDFLRFMPDKTQANKKCRYIGTLIAGPGWIIVGGLKILIGGVLGVYLLRIGYSYEQSVDPNTMYLVAFERIFGGASNCAIICTILFVIVSQIKINVTNGYAGSLAFSNFFARLTHTHPGRVVWVVFNVFIAYVFINYGIYTVSYTVLNIYSIIAISWCGCIFSDLCINKKLGLSPKNIEFRRAYLYDINPVGVGSFVIASVFGYLAYQGVFGIFLQSFCATVSFCITIICCPAIAYLTHGKFYIARAVNELHGEHECDLCKNTFDSHDLCYCPRYEKYICSLCCSLDSCCSDECKRKANYFYQLESLIPLRLRNSVSIIFLKFASYFVVYSVINLAVFLLAYYAVVSQISDDKVAVITETMKFCFFIFEFVFAILSMIFILIEDSRQRTKKEFYSQNIILEQEIKRREQIEVLLKESKDKADAANLAKTRYLSGISHELRTPLNTILGYGQILAKASDIPAKHKRAVCSMARSGEHLANLIEGLLDISKIEAGRLELHFEKVNVSLVLDELTQYFNDIAIKKGLTFNYTLLSHLPKLVVTDEKRFIQIITNLLSNAVKYTATGSVDFSISYKNEVADIKIKDTGIGIAKDDLAKIFKPFSRLDNAKKQAAGTGLGLTIINLLVTVMGGELSVESELGKGSTFRVRIKLGSATEDPLLADSQRTIIGYKNSDVKKYSVLEVDDNKEHRLLMKEILEPLGFNVFEASSPDDALEMVQNKKFDLYLVDIYMPGHDGWYLLQKLRSLNIKDPIVMVSAEVSEGNVPDNIKKLHNGYIIKPFNANRLLSVISSLLPIDFIYEESSQDKVKVNSEISQLNQADLNVDNSDLDALSIDEKSSMDVNTNPIKERSTNEQGFTKIELSDVYKDQYKANIEIGYIKGLKKLNEELFNNKIINREQKEEILDPLVYALKLDEIKRILNIMG